ncbi:NAD(P)-dependent alcohol dehydrogenase [Herbiconiux liukaitaii]|uniref:NAD(P)-dependent alcohol dehydrogenase n=1 Tax=Herbiconiux liukaitaii TaxID=3342799 RepID=UPI0035B76E7D
MTDRSRTALAAVAEVGGGMTLSSVELDELRDDEVLVQVVAAGLCHTDSSAAAGVIPFPLPGVLGHEGAGRVLAVGTGVRRTKPGDAVLLSFTSCGRCTSCRAGHPAYCDHHLPWNLLGGRRPDGSATLRRDGAELNAHFFGQSTFAEVAIADERSVVVLPPDTTDDELIDFAPLGCGLQTGAGAVLRILRPSPDSVLVVTGAGAVGLAAVMAAAAVSVSTIVVVDRVESRLELAAELGATHIIDASTSDTAEAIAAITGGLGASHAVETTGSTAVLEMLIGALSVRGTVAVIGAPRAGSRASFDVNSHLPGRSIVGVTLGDSEPEQFIPELIALYRAGRFPFPRLERRYPFTEIEKALADASSGATIKPVLVMSHAEAK